MIKAARFIILIILLNFTFLFQNMALFSIQTIEFNNYHSNLNNIGKFIDYYIDKTDKLTFDDILTEEIQDQFVKSSHNDLNIAYSKSSCWLKIKIKNNIPDNDKFVIYSFYSFLENFDLYYIDNSGSLIVKENGSNVPLNKRELKTKYYGFCLPLEPYEENTFYLKIKADFFLAVPLNIQTLDNFVKTIENDNLFIGIYYGLILIMLLFYIIILKVLHDMTYLYYIIFFIFVVSVQVILNKLLNGIFPDLTFKNNYLFLHLCNLSELFCSLYINNFFNTKKNLPKIHFLFFIIKIATVIYFFMAFFAEIIILCYAIAVITIIWIITILATGIIYYIKKGFRPAIYYILSLPVYFLGVLFLCLIGLNLIPVNIVSYYAIQIGSIFLGIVMPIALIDKYNILKKDKEIAEKTITEKEKDKFASIGMLLGGITHEIYNPLSGITGPLDNLKKALNKKDKPDFNKINKYLEYIAVNTRRIDDIIRNIRALYKNPELKKEKINIKDIAESVINYYKTNINKKIDFQLNIDDNIYITGDNNALYQILNNLISNAVDSIKDQGKVKISFAKYNDKKIIKVTDTGIGISQENINKIFDAFYTTKRTNGKHMGLGLYIVKDLINKLGWKIEVESKAEKETDFIILIKE